MSDLEAVKKLLRGARGRFVSKKKLEEKNLPVVEPVNLSFYGKTIRKFVINDKNYFSIADIFSLAKPIDITSESITYTEEYEKVKVEVIKFVGQIEVADADGIIKLVKEVVGNFPGPLAAWLKN